MSTGPRSLPETLARWISPALGLLTPGTWPDRRRTLRLAWPLATRYLRRHVLRGIFLGMCVGLSVAIFLLMASYHRGTMGDLTARTELLALPADAVVILDEPLDPGGHLPPLAARETAVIWEIPAISRWGPTGVSCVPDHLLARLDLLGGSLPREDHQVLVSERVASLAALTPGDRVDIAISGSTASLEVTGVFASYQYVMDGIIAPISAASLLIDTGDSPGNTCLVWALDNRSLSGPLQRAFPGARVVTRDLTRQAVTRMVGQAHEPGGMLLGAVYLFSGLGVLNVMLLSYLQRRRYLGLLKAQGVRGSETAAVLLTESVIMAVAGALIGAGAGALAMWLVGRLTPLHLEFPWRSLPWALVLSALAFYLGALIPAGMCRRATIHDLLYRRNIVG